MERSFVSLAGCEHEAELLNGYVDLVDSNGDKELKTPEAIYTETVLKLDGETYGIVDGQEGFLDNIKRGATKVYEWIKALIKSIKEWLFGKPKQEVAKVEKEFVNVATELDAIMAEPEKVIQGEVISTVMNSHIAEPVKHNVKRSLSRVPAEDRKIINETVVGIPGYTEKSEKIISEMAGRLTTRLDSVANNVTEIERIDPERKISKELDIDKFLIVYSKVVGGSKVFLDHANTKTIAVAAERIVKIAKEFDTALAHATNNLEKMNNKGPFAIENEESRQVARAGSIVKELGEATNKMRDLVMTLDSQLIKAVVQMETTTLMERIGEAMKQTSDASAEYLQKAMDDLKM